MDKTAPTNASSKPVTFADLRRAANGDLLIALDYCGLTEDKAAVIKKKDGHVYILQGGRLRARFPVPENTFYQAINALTKIVIAQTHENGDLQVLDKIEFK